MDAFPYRLQPPYRSIRHEGWYFLTSSCGGLLEEAVRMGVSPLDVRIQDGRKSTPVRFKFAHWHLRRGVGAI